MRFTKNDIEQAIAEWQLQGMLENPSKYDYVGMVYANLVANCPITINNRKQPDAGLRGKTVWQNPERVITDDEQIPKDFLQLHKFVT